MTIKKTLTTISATALLLGAPTIDPGEFGVPPQNVYGHAAGLIGFDQDECGPYDPQYPGGYPSGGTPPCYTPQSTYPSAPPTWVPNPYRGYQQ